MRALYDPFLHGSKRHIGSEFFVSFALGPLDCHPYHHSHLISDLLQFGILGMSVRHCHILLHLYPSLFLNFLLHLFIIFRIPFHFLLSSSRFMNDNFFGVHHPLLDIVHVDIELSHLAHTILRYLTLCTQGFSIIY